MTHDREILSLKSIPDFKRELTIRRLANTYELKSRREDSSMWVSEKGSRYLFDGREFVCISVHDSCFIGWIGKTAVRIVRPSAFGWSGLQAIRNMQTGALSHWVPVSILLGVGVVTKSFPANVPAEILVYGLVEHYRRVQLDDDGW